jgi:hypothetical protein
LPALAAAKASATNAQHGTAATTTHSSCLRSSPRERRKRTASEIAATSTRTLFVTAASARSGLTADVIAQGLSSCSNGCSNGPDPKSFMKNHTTPAATMT